MTGLIRIALIMIIIFLLQRAFSGNKSPEQQNGGTGVKSNPGEKKGRKSKELGEYIDYEEVKKTD